MRLSDAGLRRLQTKLIYLNHRSPPWFTEDAPRDRSNRLLDCRAAPAPKLPLNGADELTPSLALCKLPTPSSLQPSLNGDRSILRRAQRAMRRGGGPNQYPYASVLPNPTCISTLTSDAEGRGSEGPPILSLPVNPRTTRVP